MKKIIFMIFFSMILMACNQAEEENLSVDAEIIQLSPTEFKIVVTNESAVDIYFNQANFLGRGLAEDLRIDEQTDELIDSLLAQESIRISSQNSDELSIELSEEIKFLSFSLRFVNVDDLQEWQEKSITFERNENSGDWESEINS